MADEVITDTTETAQDGTWTTGTADTDTSTTDSETIDTGDSNGTDSSSDTDDTETTVSLEDELTEDLTSELSVSDEIFNADLLKSKIKTVIREVKKARNYPSYYTDERINTDLYEYYTNIRSLALYDYNTVGIEGQTSSSENNTSRSYIDRNTLFSGVIPLSRM